MVDDLLRQMLRHLVPQQRHHHLVAGDDDLGDVLLLDDLLQRVDDFFGVMDVEVFDVALIARLRPAALRRALGLDAFDLVFRDHVAGREHQNPRRVGVGEHRRIARMQ